MLRKLYVHNFKTLLNFTFEPKGLNLLIGRNNVGKTNLCQAMHFLSLTTRKSLASARSEAVGLTWSFTNRYYKETTAEFACECELPLNGERYRFDYRLSINVPNALEAGAQPRMVSETLDVSGGGRTNWRLITAAGDRVHFTDESGAPRPPGVDIDVGGKVWGPATTGLSLVTGGGPTTRLMWEFKSYLESWASYDLENSRLRDTAITPLDPRLARNGSNLAYLIHTLKMGDDRAYRELLELTRALAPELHAINFLGSPDPSQVFMVFEDAEGRRFFPQQLSNGTLRFLALLCISARNRQDAQRGAPPPLSLIEEPETGIFVGELKGLLESIDPTGREGQYVFTSHSPYFIDLFDAHLDGVFLLKREKTHTTLVQPDPERVRRLIEEDFPLGELHFREMLG
ncbi:MAG: hypothetical protein FJ291_26335 [Planctomycetes bacterium]|nr:hypothetical protein [Planctomycetota bacterium]